MKKLNTNKFKRFGAKRVLLLNDKTGHICGVFKYNWCGALYFTETIPCDDTPSLYKVIFKDQSRWYVSKMELTNPYGIFKVKISTAKDKKGDTILLCKTDLDEPSFKFFARQFSFFTMRFPFILE